MPDSGPTPLRTLRLNQDDQRQVLARVDRAGRRPVEKERRSLRVTYQPTRPVVVRLHQPDGQITSHHVVTRNLSRRGLAFLHGRFVYAESQCEIVLPTLGKKWWGSRGTVLRCRHVSGIVHEVCVRFDKPIDLRDFVELSPEEAKVYDQQTAAEPVCESIEPIAAARHGRSLVIDPCGDDLRLLSLWLDKLGLGPRGFTDPAQALEVVRGGAMQTPDGQAAVDVMIVDASTRIGRRKTDYSPAPGSEGEAHDESAVHTAIARLRSRGLGAPILAVSATDNAAVRAAALAAGAQAFLPKPIDPASLRQSLENLLAPPAPADDSPQDIRSIYAEDPDMAPLVHQFVSSLPETAQRVRDLHRRGDREELARLCTRLKGSGTSYGLEVISALAKLLLSRLADEGDTDQAITAAVNELTQTLGRVK